MPRLAICGLIALIAVTTSACATKTIPGRYTQDIRDDITRVRIESDRGGMTAPR